MLVIRGEECKDLNNVLKKEWTETNLYGSYANNNLICHNNKNEHSLLSIPYQNSFLTLVSSVIEEVTLESNHYYTNLFKSKDKNNNIFFEKFYIDLHPHFIYNFAGIKLQKSILMIYDKNILIIKYKILHVEKPLSLKVSPLVSIKEYNSAIKTANIKYSLVKEPNYAKFVYSDNINIFFYFKNSVFNEKKEVVINKIIKGEESYTSFGEFQFDFASDNDEYYIGFSHNRIKEDIQNLFNKEKDRRMSLIKSLKIKNELYKNIIITSEFYIKKEKEIFFLKNSLVSPFISFQKMTNSLNILFALRKYEIIKDILKFLANHSSQGLIPDNLNNDKKSFTYTSIDNSFWYLLFLFKFIEFTGDWKFVKDFLWEKIKPVFHNFHNNHIENIKTDYDGLLSVQSELINNSPENKLIEYKPGKNLALNILWYNAVKIMELLSAKFADIEYHTHTEELSFIIKKNFYYKFFNKEKKIFSNRIDIPPQNNKEDELTPYQIFIISLPFNDLTHYKTKINIIHSIKEKLLTPYGLRTLAADSKEFVPNYNPEQPGSAYRGVVHPYLLFHYLTAHLKINKYSKTAKKEVKYFLINFEKKLKQNNIGGFPQFINSLPPYESSGKMDSSLSLSEYLRIRYEELGSF